ncbi:hypothetical protein NM208_g7740 [Fusarium decemcellulare]|uniref:Uncharacterized protein n=1 Tax=Fusarium decemcellulare TaxID=57161 RepID=A0ACC1S7X3_9HYPO|nr:hypothetical protein NM208_g7740 [Fusarium decemcellulare]
MQAVARARGLRVKDTKPHIESTIEVIGAGLPRCATSSIHFALEADDMLDLGPALHMKRILLSSKRAQLALQAMEEVDRDKRHKLIKELCAGCRSCIDWPVPMFVHDLMDIYPEARIVLNHRPGAPEQRGESWAKSCQDILWFYNTLTYYWVGVLFKTMRIHYKMAGFGLVYIGILCELLRLVKREAAKRGREILEWQPNDGWDPLCKFIDKEIPNDSRSFPHINDTAEMKRIEQTVKVVGVASWVTLGALMFVAIRYGPEFVTSALWYLGI